MDTSNIKLYNRLTVLVSVLVPVVVALLLFLKWDADKLIFDLRSPNFEPIILADNLPLAKPLKFLPPIYATINGITAVVLVMAVYFKSGALSFVNDDDLDGIIDNIVVGNNGLTRRFSLYFRIKKR